METNHLNILQTARSGTAIYDSSKWGKIIVSDRDRLRFLHNQSTADFENRQAGEGCDTVFVTSTARTIDLATGLILADEVLLIGSPNRRAIRLIILHPLELIR
jgi:tRNA-modifying protein YgfZ